MSVSREAARQRSLMSALTSPSWQRGAGEPLSGWLHPAPAAAAGLAAYRTNAAAHAERALLAAYPTVQRLLGDEAFAALARAHWHADPPLRGDLAQWGGGLAGFVADDAQLAELPYLADVCRLEWAVHQAEQAADATPAPDLALLGRVDPDRLRVRLCADTALVESAYPVVTIWHAHRSGSDGADAFAQARDALAARQAETALVQRDGWRASVRALPAADARFTAALLQRASLAAALRLAGSDFSFETWLIAVLQRGAVAAIEELP